MINEPITHIDDPRFESQADFYDIFNTCVDVLGTTKITLIEAKKLLTRVYETKFSIHNHFNERKSVFSDVLAHDFNDGVYTGLYSERASQFVENKIHELYGISLDEFLNKPRHQIEILLRSAEKILKRRSEELKSLGIK